MENVLAALSERPTAVTVLSRPVAEGLCAPRGFTGRSIEEPALTTLSLIWRADCEGYPNLQAFLAVTARGRDDQSATRDFLPLQRSLATSGRR